MGLRSKRSIVDIGVKTAWLKWDWLGLNIPEWVPHDDDGVDQSETA